MNRNKQAIIGAFWELLEEKPLSKITVKVGSGPCLLKTLPAMRLRPDPGLRTEHTAAGSCRRECP